MEVGQGPNWGCSAKGGGGNKIILVLHFTKFDDMVNYTPDLDPQLSDLRRYDSRSRSHGVLSAHVTVREK
jgi:hypothetical protein